MPDNLMRWLPPVESEEELPDPKDHPDCFVFAKDLSTAFLSEDGVWKDISKG